MIKTPTISVIIPCYNSAAFVGHTLASLQAQSFTDWEAIVVDDGSTDATGQILSSWTNREHRIRLVSQNNQGLAKARNVGILNARGKFIHFLDSDDWMLQGAYVSMATRLLNQPNVAGVYCGMAVATEGGSIQSQHERAVNESIDFPTIALGNQFPVHAVLIRRDVLNVVGLFDETLKHCQDWDLWGRVLRCGFELVPEQRPFAVYRMVRASLSARHNTFWRAGTEVLQRLYSKDHRCPSPVEVWVHGADRVQYPLSVKKWALYCLPRAILSGDTEMVEEILAALSSDPNALPEPRELAGALFRGLVMWNPDGRRTCTTVWHLRQNLIVRVLTRIGKAARKRAYVSDVLGDFLWRVQRTLGVRESLRISATVRYVPRFVFKEAERRTRRWLQGPTNRLTTQTFSRL
jgi:glycosyltransferase involved in cell wall biosynthesis